MATLLPEGKQHYETAAGLPLVGGKLFTYDAGTLVPRATYADAAQTVPNANPVLLDARGEATVFWSGAYKIILQDSLGNVIWTVDAVVSTDTYSTSAIQALTALLADTANVANGDAMIGVKTTRGGSIATTQHQVNEERLSVFQYMTAAQIADVVANTALVDVTAAIQAAINAQDVVYFPLGTYRIGGKITMGINTRMMGCHEHKCIIRAVGYTGVIFEYPISAYDCVFEYLTVFGAGCTGVAVAAGGGTLHDYLIRFSIHHAHFGGEMAFGINADCIFLDAYKCSFGYETFGVKNGTMVCLKSYSVGGNYTNINTVDNCIFCNSTLAIGAASAIAVDLSGGDIWRFTACDWEQGGSALRCSNITKLSMTDCWLEALTSAGNVVDNAATGQKSEFKRCNFINITVGTAAIQWNSGASPGIVVDNCAFTIANAGFCIFDNTTSSTGFDGGGKVEWRNCLVSGGGGTMVTQTASRRECTIATKGMAVIITSAGAPVTVTSTEPLTYGRNGVGDININLTHPAATATAKVGPLVCGNLTVGRASGIASGSNIRVQLFSIPTLAAAEDSFTVYWGGN